MWHKGHSALFLGGEGKPVRGIFLVVFASSKRKYDSEDLYVCVISQANLIPGKWLMVERVTYNCQRHTCMHNTSCTRTDAEKHLPHVHPPNHTHTHRILSVSCGNIISVVLRRRRVNHSWPFCLRWPFQIETLWTSFLKENMWTVFTSRKSRSGMRQSHYGGYGAPSVWCCRMYANAAW